MTSQGTAHGASSAPSSGAISSKPNSGIRWHGRLATEVQTLTLAEAQLAFAAVASRIAGERDALKILSGPGRSCRPAREDRNGGREMTTRSGHASFADAAGEIVRILADGEWHKSIDDIHTPLRPWVSEGMFGKVKSCFMIESRREAGGPGSYYVWRLRNPRRDVMVAHLLDEGVPFDQAKAMVSELLGGESFVDGQNGECAGRPTLRGQIIRDRKSLVLRWGEFHHRHDFCERVGFRDRAFPVERASRLL